MDPPPQPQRRVEPPRRMPPDRSFDRADLRDPPRAEGGALRAFVLIALLGGAALAGGLYFGGGMGDLGASASRQEPSEISSAALDAPSEVPLGEPADIDAAAAPPLERPTPVSSREEPPAPIERPREAAPPRTVAATTEPPPSGGPLSLVPGSSSSSATNPSSTVVPLGPPQTTPPVATAATASEPAALRGAPASVAWAQRPSARRIAELYPQRALREGMGGRVQLDCTVQPGLTVACTIASESPAGEGFGRAALSAANAYRARPTLSDGTSAVGARARIAVAFQAPQ
jgi:protein TonB